MRNAFVLVLLLCAACSAPQSPPVADNTAYAVPRPDDPEYGRLASRQIEPRGLFLLVDKSDRLLVVYRDGQAVRAYRGIQFGDAPLGHKRFEGDERTPEGRYTIDTRNPQSSYHLSLRISYPNAQDRAFAAQYGRSPGGDIFIHGQPNGLDDSLRMRGDWTDGCIALTNSEIEELWRIVPDGTPIHIRP